MSKYDEWFKRSVVDDYERSGDGSGAVARRHGLDHSTVRKWVATYRAHGVAGLQKKYSHYDARFKLTVLQRIATHSLSLRAAAARFDIRDAQRIAQWKRQYDSGGIEALKPRRRGRPMKQPNSPLIPEVPKTGDARTRADLLKENDYLRMENAYLKKLDALIQADKLAAQRKKRK